MFEVMRDFIVPSLSGIVGALLTFLFIKSGTGAERQKMNVLYIILTGLVFAVLINAIANAGGMNETVFRITQCILMGFIAGAYSYPKVYSISKSVESDEVVEKEKQTDSKLIPIAAGLAIGLLMFGLGWLGGMTKWWALILQLLIVGFMCGRFISYKSKKEQ